MCYDPEGRSLNEIASRWKEEVSSCVGLNRQVFPCVEERDHNAFFGKITHGEHVVPVGRWARVRQVTAAIDGGSTRVFVEVTMEANR